MIKLFINKYQPFDYTNIQVGIVQEGNLQERGDLSLKVYLVTDDRTTTIELTLFEELIKSITKKGTSFIRRSSGYLPELKKNKEYQHEQRK